MQYDHYQNTTERALASEASVASIMLKSQKYYVMINGEKVKCVIHAFGGML